MLNRTAAIRADGVWTGAGSSATASAWHDERANAPYEEVPDDPCGVHQPPNVRAAVERRQIARRPRPTAPGPPRSSAHLGNRVC